MPALVRLKAPLMILPIEAVDPALTLKVEFAVKVMPLPEKVQLPEVVAEPKVRPVRF